MPTLPIDDAITGKMGVASIYYLIDAPVKQSAIIRRKRLL